MDKPIRTTTVVSALLASLLLASCEGPRNVLTLEGTYSGTTESSCSVGVFDARTFKLVEAHAGEPSFKLDYTVDKGSYYVEIHCVDGKFGRSPPFDFEPPRARVTLRNIELL
jgi:hypothetical protein